jgi:hypothetical protein
MMRRKPHLSSPCRSAAAPFSLLPSSGTEVRCSIPSEVYPLLKASPERHPSVPLDGRNDLETKYRQAAPRSSGPLRIIWV